MDMHGWVMGNLRLTEVLSHMVCDVIATALFICYYIQISIKDVDLKSTSNTSTNGRSPSLRTKYL